MISIKLEEKLRNIIFVNIDIKNDELKKLTVKGMITMLNKYGYLDKSWVNNYENFRIIRNNVVHGRDISIDDIEIGIELGVSLLHNLEEIKSIDTNL